MLRFALWKVSFLAWKHQVFWHQINAFIPHTAFPFLDGSSSFNRWASKHMDVGVALLVSFCRKPSGADPEFSRGWWSQDSPVQLTRVESYTQNFGKRTPPTLLRGFVRWVGAFPGSAIVFAANKQGRQSSTDFRGRSKASLGLSTSITLCRSEVVLFLANQRTLITLWELLPRIVRCWVEPHTKSYFRAWNTVESFQISENWVKMQGTNQWQNGLFGCFNNCGICIVTFLVPCYTYGKSQHTVHTCHNNNRLC